MADALKDDPDVNLLAHAGLGGFDPLPLSKAPSDQYEAAALIVNRQQQIVADRQQNLAVMLASALARYL